MRDPRRSYETYEALGQQLETLAQAQTDVQRTLMDMWQTQDEQGRPVPSSHERRGLDVARTVNELLQALALDFQMEIDEPDVPPDKPATPPPFDSPGGGGR